MGKNHNKNQKPRNNEIEAKLSFHEGFKERPFYRIVAKTNEKEKGVGMADLIENMFGISKKDRKIMFNKVLNEFREKRTALLSFGKERRGGSSFPPVNAFLQLKKEREERASERMENLEKARAS